MGKFETKSPATTEKSVEAGQSSVENPARTEPVRSGGELPTTLERLMWVSSITLGNVVILGGAGYLADGFFHTKPWLLITGLVLAFIGTQVLVYKKMMSLIKRPATSDQRPAKGK